MPKAEVLIVDTNAFIQTSYLQDLGTRIITVADVLHEVKNRRQLKRLAVVPYDIEVLEPFPENVKFVTEFAKKTGDYPSLSAVDLKIIALTYQLEKEKVGIDHLAKEPTQKKEVVGTKKSLINSTALPGFYYPKKEEGSEEDSGNSSETETPDDNEVCNRLASLKCVDGDFEQLNGSLTEIMTAEETEKSIKQVENNIEDRETFKDARETNNSESEEEEESSDVDDDDDDEEGWITPENINEMKMKMGGEMIEDKPVVVGCLTMDFAMQNVMKQIGLNIVTINGFVIKQLRTFIFRCYSCFKTTSVMTKIFCPNCGNKTLKKVAVSLDENGKQIIHINYRRRITSKGKKHSIPTPKGGKHVVRPITVADQPMPKQHASKLSKTKNNPLDPDYIAGYSPFVMRDVNSKSAMLGIYANRFINDPKYMKQVSRISESGQKKSRRK